jgi:hypothetical protein
MLEVEEAKRWTAEECLRHAWITNRQQVPRVHLAETVDNIRRYNVRRRLKVRVNAAMGYCFAQGQKSTSLLQSNITAAINNERWKKASSDEIDTASAGGDSCDFDSILLRRPPLGGDESHTMGGVQMVRIRPRPLAP